MNPRSEFNICLVAKKIYRLLVLVITVLALIMVATGTILKYPQLGEIMDLNLESARYLHNQLSPYLAVVLVIMILTGLVMYISFTQTAVKQRKGIIN